MLLVVLEVLCTAKVCAPASSTTAYKVLPLLLLSINKRVSTRRLKVLKIAQDSFFLISIIRDKESCVYVLEKKHSTGVG
jgi:uncharacterized membrane protein YhfC